MSCRRQAVGRLRLLGPGARLIRDSLRLGNDRIQFGQIESGTEEATLLRSESPFFFLIQACRELLPLDQLKTMTIE